MLGIPRGCVTNQPEESTRSWGITHTLEPAAAYKVMCLFLTGQGLDSQRGSGEGRVCVRGGSGDNLLLPIKLRYRRHLLLRRWPSPPISYDSPNQLQVPRWLVEMHWSTHCITSTGRIDAWAQTWHTNKWSLNSISFPNRRTHLKTPWDVLQ